jgi:hypothetical protein
MNRDDQFTYFGADFLWDRPTAITDTDRRQHMYLIGRTGTGKSTLIENLILQDIYRGLGIAFVDPHGTSAERLLDRIPSFRTRDVVYFRPADLERPLGINLLEEVHPDQAHFVAQGVVGAFKSIWSDSWGPRMDRIFYNAVAALLDRRNSTLLGVLCLLIDDEYRKRIVPDIHDPIIRQFWEIEYPGYGQQLKQEAIAPIQNKVERFLSSAVMRNIFGQKKSTVNFFDLINSNKIFIANLSKGEIGEMNCNLIGSLLAT